MSRIGVWASWAAGLGLLCVGCGSACGELADLLRECCAKGPAELRQSCEAEATRLEEEGSSDKCQTVLDQRTYEGCRR